MHQFQESDREKSVLGKQAKMFFNWMNPKKPTKRVHQNEQQQVNVEKNSSTLSNLEDKPDVSNETLDGQASQSVSVSFGISSVYAST